LWAARKQAYDREQASSKKKPPQKTPQVKKSYNSPKKNHAPFEAATEDEKTDSEREWKDDEVSKSICFLDVIKPFDFFI